MERSAEDAFEPLAAPPWSADWSSEGVIAVLEPLVLPPRRERVLSVVEQRIGSVTVVMDAPHDPHNGAAVMRSCDAFGVQQLHVVPRTEPFLVSGGVAKGTERWIDVIRHPTPEAAIEALQSRGFELVATHPAGELLPAELAGIERLALVLGNEHDGICQALKQAARRSVRIPMRGFVESLNVSVSAAVLLEAATHGRPGDLPEAEKRLLYARGLFRSVSRAAEVLAASSPR